MIGQDDVVFGLPEDLALTASATKPGTAEWADIVGAATSFHQQRGEVMVESWVEEALTWWRDAGYPGQPARAASCPDCGACLDGAYCDRCDVAYGASWWADPEKRPCIGLYERPWRLL